MRRSRFTITYSPDDSNEILRTVVLAYSADSIRMRYSIPGATILGIERGDYRAKARAAAVQRQTCPDNLRRWRSAGELVGGHLAEQRTGSYA